jgi:hypothetical protein
MAMDPFQKPEGISWNAAPVELPPMPTIAPGEDAMSMTIAAVLPTLHTPLATSVAALSAKENMFSGKIGEAQGAYENADDQGGQSVGQLSSMLGQVGQMAQQAGGAAGGAGGGSSIFGSLMEQAMKAAQSAGGSQSGSSQEGSAGQQAAGGMAPAGQPAASQGSAGGSAAAANPQEQRQAEAPAHEAPAEHDDREERDAKQHQGPAEKPLVEATGPGSGKHDAGPAPVAPPESHRRGDDDLARRM